jgi:signal transduction histidine kinase
LAQTYLDADIHALVIYDRQGRRVAGNVYDLQRGEPVAAPPFSLNRLSARHPLLPGSRGETGREGLLRTPMGPMLVAARPILTSENRGPSRGTLIMGRLLDARRVQSVADRALIDLRVQRLAPNAPVSQKPAPVTPLADGRLRAARTVMDLSGSPIVEVSVTHEPTLTRRVRRSMRYALLAVAGACGALAVAVCWVLRKTVTGPLAALTEHAVRVGREDNLTARLNLQRRDEVGVLAGQFDRMLDRLACSREKVNDHRERLRQLTRRLSEAEQRQNRHLAGQLHDGVNQSLFGLKAKLAQVRGAAGDADTRTAADEALRLVDQAMTELRTISMGLHPPVLRDLGLAAGLEWLADQTHRQHGLACEVRAENADDLPEDLAAALFQAARELVTNCVKYARARQVTIELAVGAGPVRLSVRDDGVGFDPADQAPVDPQQGRFGLFALRERVEAAGGEFQLSTGIGRGTEVTVKIPLAPGKPPANSSSEES